ncbi:TPA: hypothetical protein QDZ75_004492 [Stenotrophomonas maltophilia]|uniref:Transmembrane protein n=1 Tax=Stenotrophomonas maltophilia TaxID=40324 RepID=A0A2J0UIB6_STEMA|nr:MULTISPECIES: hypothetical protein [Stenotrophomonas]PJL34597.1 hypothetical protein B9Y64_05850 [Stenotrophomonas maltophilia]HDS1140403.1 hypothetical protein [Stenotrophomonas maltophilia]HDS1149023.1 hypothetical protein [Stenotrophomonas maltophilia]HDS1163176.1 hypothetical protein [Stenotrophomonas maltophilia]HEL5402126.1 hypothetical protein [Stenotrophomonas maltophilia]
MHNESPLPIGRVEPGSTGEKQPGMARLHNSEGHGVEQQRRRARRTAMWVGGIAVLVYVGFILSGVVGR